VIAKTEGVFNRVFRTDRGTIGVAVIGNVVSVGFEPRCELGRVLVEVTVRGDEPVTAAALAACRFGSPRGDPKALEELARVIDAGYPNYLPCGMYSALVNAG
jgi:hypothetical protein